MPDQASKEGINKKIAEELASSMGVSPEDTKKWLAENEVSNLKMTPEQHAAFLKKMGITDEQDEQWHREHQIPPPENKAVKAINPFAIGGGFLKYCVNQGWLIQEGKGRNSHYYVTESGIENLKEFGIIIEAEEQDR